MRYFPVFLYGVLDMTDAGANHIEVLFGIVFYHGEQQLCTYQYLVNVVVQFFADCITFFFLSFQGNCGKALLFAALAVY